MLTKRDINRIECGYGPYGSVRAASNFFINREMASLLIRRHCTDLFFICSEGGDTDKNDLHITYDGYRKLLRECGFVVDDKVTIYSWNQISVVPIRFHGGNMDQ